MKFTAASVQKIKPTDKRQETPDSLCVGLYLVVQPSGKRGWQVRYRHGGKHRRMSLGPFPALALVDARQRAREVVAAVAEGRDPAEELRSAKAPKSEDDRETVKALVAQHANRHLSQIRTGKAVARQLELHVVSRWGDRNIPDIKKRDVINLLDEIADSGHPTASNRVRAYVSKFMNWCVERDILEHSPAFGVKPLSKERTRDRVLTDDEVRWFWEACARDGQPWGTLGMTLLLTAQRKAEVAGIDDAEVTGEAWRIPPARTKNGRPHLVPLSRPVLDLLAGMDRIEGPAGLYFTTNGHTPVSGFSKVRDRLAARMIEIATEEAGRPVEIPRWTFHDLRRTAATGMARLGIPVRVTEAVLNHVSGTGGGIVGVYQRHDYADEKRDALEAWGRFVTGLAAGTAGNVVRLEAAR